MLVHKLKTVPVAVQPQVIAESQFMRLVHSDQDAAAAERGACGTDHILDERIRFGSTDKQGVLRVPNAVRIVPFQSLLEMGECLDAGYDLNSEQASVVVDLLQLLLRIAS